mmetsp:Transcript_21184/g.30289  ORF Transcript_21184/g.30289 Transcript_21184/m.30289 type:complete len:263 (-) Transcript_21184:846-1634(-)
MLLLLLFNRRTPSCSTTMISSTIKNWIFRSHSSCWRVMHRIRVHQLRSHSTIIIIWSIRCIVGGCRFPCNVSKWWIPTTGSSKVMFSPVNSFWMGQSSFIFGRIIILFFGMKKVFIHRKNSRGFPRKSIQCIFIWHFCTQTMKSGHVRSNDIFRCTGCIFRAIGKAYTWFSRYRTLLRCGGIPCSFYFYISTWLFSIGRIPFYEWMMSRIFFFVGIKCAGLIGRIHTGIVAARRRMWHPQGVFLLVLVVEIFFFLFFLALSP